MTVATAQLLSVALYLVPVAVLLVCRARRDRALDEMALDIPLAVAADLLSILLVTKWVPLETAALASRAIWIGAGISATVSRCRRGDAPAWPSAFRARAIGTVGVAVAATLWLCSFISRKYVVWDSQWHTSIVATLGTERIPFSNPLMPVEVLHYHFSGDVLAAMQRTFSWNVISANRALASAHDLMFALGAAAVTLMVLGRRRPGAALSSLACLAVFFNGPIPLRGGVGFSFLGYEYHSFVTLSYRPHVCLAGLLMVGVLGAVATRLKSEDALDRRHTLATLVACFALLGVTDETSTALLGIGLGIVWLFAPEVLAASRWRGLAVLVGLAASIVVVNLLFQAALAPGGPVQKVTLSPEWRLASLGIEHPSLPLASEKGKEVFFVDMMPFMLTLGALALHAVRRRARGAGVLFVTATLVTALAVGLALRIDVNGDSTEAHRFFVAPLLMAALLTVLTLPEMRRGSLEVALALLGAGVPAVSSVLWLSEIAPGFLSHHKASDVPSQNVFATNCAVATGAGLGDRPRALYVEPSQFTRFVGCRAVLSPAKTEASWSTKITPLVDSGRQLAALERALPMRDELEAICWKGAATSDAVCSRALRVPSSCRPEGDEFLRCPLDRALRDEALGRAH